MLRSLLAVSALVLAACATNTSNTTTNTVNPTNSATTQMPAPNGESKTNTVFNTAKMVYPLGTCVVSGKPLTTTAVTFTVEGRTFKTCCTNCKTKVETDPATFTKKLDAATIQQQLTHYPLTTCPVSGTKLGTTGTPVQTLIDGTLVQFCSANCAAKAKTNPDPVVDRVRQAAFEAQTNTYPLTTCVVSGKQLDAYSTSTLVGTTLVRTCCTKCADVVATHPEEYLTKIETARTTTGTTNTATGTTNTTRTTNTNTTTIS